MAYSAKYTLLRTYYLTGMWDEARLRNAVVKEWITAAEFTLITGFEY